MTVRPRSSWTRSGPAAPLTRLDPDRVLGVVLHWPGSTRALGNPPAASVAKRIEGYRRHHVAVRGWSDIAYSVVIDQAGRVWDARGIAHRSAANGTATGNDRYGAVLLLLGPGESIPPAMIEGFRTWHRSVWLARYPRATRVVGHGDVKITECPGPIIRSALSRRAFTESDVATKLTKDDLAAITGAVLDTDGVVQVLDPPDPDNPRWKVKSVLTHTLDQARTARHQVDAARDDLVAVKGQLTSVAARVDAMAVQVGQLVTQGVNVDCLANYLTPHLERIVGAAVQQALAELLPPAQAAHTDQGKGQ